MSLARTWRIGATGADVMATPTPGSAIVLALAADSPSTVASHLK